MAANVTLRDHMAHLGLTQEELARRMNAVLEQLEGRPSDVSARTVRNLLSGSTRRPNGRTRVALEAVFGCPASDLGFSSSASSSGDEQVRRRTFLAVAGGSAVAATPAGHRRLGQSDIDRYNREHLALTDDAAVLGGTRGVESKAVQLAARIHESLDSADSSGRVRRQMYLLAAGVTCLAASAAIDASAPLRARAHLGNALTLAGLAHDSASAFRAWDHLMLTSSQRENHAEAATGADVMKRSSLARRDPSYASLGHMRHANALARLGESKESLRALALAEQAYGKAGSPSAPAWISFYHRAEFDALSSYVWTALGEHERAESCLHRTLAVLPDGAVRDRGLYTAHLSLAQARQGEAELACATARRAHALAPPGSRRTTNTLVRTRQVLTALGTRAPEVMSWIEEARTWN
ncbi:XRE family transcriptional regulator [Streptomyces koyangensis]|uniref:XRE family transcriptional regulator n=1 Tax=Streptomyces koyangensis TaxID=188770 RepID=UPI00364DB1F7